MALKPNAIAVFNYVKEHNDDNITATGIAQELGLEVKSVNGIVTSAFQKKGLMERVPGEIEQKDGSHRSVKFIHLTPLGEEFDPLESDK